MTPRFTLIALGSASFVVTLVLCAWRDGFWERSVDPVAVTQTALPQVPAPQRPVKADAPRAQPEAADPAAAMSVPVVTDDSPASPPDPTAPEASERQLQRRGEAARGARTR